ncbi:hypothetical protein [Kribbella shirazensis]|uniref:Uncharacterized protein n=1 Tax=Kribbella shirazensis TaxID=1105143 RepID=A0A7X5VBQ0_9ACTN|nr:hypothetical protein [Kribbella shirazensis]NIK58275.1 hypothetical protein [Kribbella shirazensis]
MSAGYSLILASSVGERDGIGLEPTRVDGGCAAEVFEDADTGNRVVNVFDKNVPVEAIEWLLAEARARL